MAMTVEQIAEELDGLTLLQAAQLSKMLQEKWGVSAAAPGMAATAIGAAADTPHFSCSILLSCAASSSVSLSSSSAICSTLAM